MWSRRNSMRRASPHGSASRISRQLFTLTKLATELINRVSADVRISGSFSRLSVKRLTSATPKNASKSCGSNAVISLKSPIRTISRRPTVPRERRKEVEHHKGPARISDANFQKKRKKCKQQTGREPANENFADFEARLGAVRKIVVTAPAHAQDVNKARQ